MSSSAYGSVRKYDDTLYIKIEYKRSVYSMARVDVLYFTFDMSCLVILRSMFSYLDLSFLVGSFSSPAA